MATNTTNPFGFAPEKFAEMFAVPGLERWFAPTALPLQAMVEAQQKNFEALVEANKVAASGYQDLFERMNRIFEESMARASEQVNRAQSQDLSADAAAKNAEIMKDAFERALTDLRELTEIAQKANTDAFGVIRARAEQVVTEFKAATVQ